MRHCMCREIFLETRAIFGESSSVRLSKVLRKGNIPDTTLGKICLNIFLVCSLDFLLGLR